MDLIVGLSHTRQQHDSIWVIVDGMTKSTNFTPIKISYSAEFFAMFYFREMVRFLGVPLPVISYRGIQLTYIFEILYTNHKSL